jgi:hypothetical protein
LVACAAVALPGARVAVAQAPCADPDPCATAARAQYVGDLNADGTVNAVDVTFWQDCIRDNLAASGVYCAFGDLNFDGRIDDDDLNYLQQAVTLASDPLVGQLPLTRISEVRTGKSPTQTNPLIPQSRYVELETPGSGVVSPTTNAPNPADATNTTLSYRAGWYYLKVTQSRVAGVTQYGTIAVVVPLDGMVWCSAINPPGVPNAQSTFQKSLIADSSFVPGSVLYQAVPNPNPTNVNLRDFILQLPPGQSLEIPNAAGGALFPDEDSINVTHLVVFRNPDPANPRAEPEVGQRVSGAIVDPADRCAFPWLVPGSGDLPPWDVISDAVTLIRGTSTAYGCIMASTGISDIGPVGVGGDIEAPIHVYRCRSIPPTNDNLRVGPRTIRSESDTPFRANFTCTFVPTGCGEFSPGGGFRSCFEVHPVGRGCTDADCCLAVADIDASCRLGPWDELCVTIALSTCTTCGETQTSCTEPHPTPSCSDATCCEEVCGIDPACCKEEWDATCAQIATQQCLGCGKAAAGPCSEPHDTPFCADEQCCNLVCDVRPYCCETAWDEGCVSIANAKCGGCGSPGTGNCCIVHATPYCNDGGCCESVCAVDPSCCSISWDLACTLLTLNQVACLDLGCTCGLLGPDETILSCFEERREPGCSDSYCCQLICVRDPYCCFVAWDSVCVDAANDNCTLNKACLNPVTGLPVDGDCFVPHETPGCNLPACCDTVCELDPSCCEADSTGSELAWDETCAKIALKFCIACGQSFSGSCFETHGSPNCSDEQCCTSVCTIDPFCCFKEWDFACVSLAFANCDSPQEACGLSPRSCWVPSYWTAGCSDAACCARICSQIDPYCCDTRWDAICAYQANFACTPSFPTQIGRESCEAPHESPGCAVPDCMRGVCSVDPTCCTEQWDVRCVQIAAGVCTFSASCPAAGSCFSSHASPGCEDSACCNATCYVDPSCCVGEWDSSCANLARSACRPPAGSDRLCPCVGDCFLTHGSAGCDDETCCNVVCNINPDCCEETWDVTCVGLARLHCCGAIGCGSGCNKSCVQAHADPFCDDPVCCDVVCRLDPSCCEFGWDGACVTIARSRCATSCGMSDAGNCWDSHLTPGCSDPQCCAFVCSEDPFCCTFEWDSSCRDLANANPARCIRPSCGDPGAGDPCVPHQAPASNSSACCAAVCVEDSYCCEVQWDSSCAAAAVQNPSCPCFLECGDPCAGDCCSSHGTPKCNDATCCEVVCKADPFCCESSWDFGCAEIARDICAAACPPPECGSDELQGCCTVSVAPFCSDQQCCDSVCNVDPFCCTDRWDATCVLIAQSPAQSGACECANDPCTASKDSCAFPHKQPGCSDTACCQAVCAQDPGCCETSWDLNCVEIAKVQCTAPGLLPAKPKQDPTLRVPAGGLEPPARPIPVRPRGLRK